MLSRSSSSPSQSRLARFSISKIKHRLSDLGPRRHSSSWMKMTASNGRYCMLESEIPIGVGLVEYAAVDVDDLPSTSAIVERLPPYSPTEVTPSVTIQEISPAASTTTAHQTTRQLRSLYGRNGRVRFPAIEWGEAHPRVFRDSIHPIKTLRHAGLRIVEGDLTIEEAERIPLSPSSPACGESVSSGRSIKTMYSFERTMPPSVSVSLPLDQPIEAVIDDHLLVDTTDTVVLERELLPPWVTFSQQTGEVGRARAESMIRDSLGLPVEFIGLSPSSSNLSPFTESHEAFQGDDVAREGQNPRTEHPAQSETLSCPLYQDVYPSFGLESSQFSHRPATSFRDDQAFTRPDNGSLSLGMDSAHNQSFITTRDTRPSPSRATTSETVTGEELEKSGERLYQSLLQEVVSGHELHTDTAGEGSTLRKDSHRPTGEAHRNIVPKPETLATNGEALKECVLTGEIARMNRGRNNDKTIDEDIVINDDDLTGMDEASTEGPQSHKADISQHSHGHTFDHKRQRHPPLMDPCSRPIYTGPRRANPFICSQTDIGRGVVGDSNREDQIQQRADTIAYNYVRDGGLTPPSPMPKVCIATATEIELMQETELTRDRLHDEGTAVGSAVQDNDSFRKREDSTDGWFTEDGSRRRFYKALDRQSPLRHGVDFSGTPAPLKDPESLRVSPYPYHQDDHPGRLYIEQMGNPREVPGRVAALLSSKLETGEIPWARLTIAEQSRQLGGKSSRGVKMMVKTFKDVLMQTASKTSEGDDTEMQLERARADALRDMGRVTESEVLGKVSSFAYGASGF